MSADVRADLVATCVVPVVSYACTTAPLAKQALTSLRTSVLSTILDTEARFRCAEVAFAVLWPGHRLDPFFAPDYCAILSFTRVFAQSASFRTSVAVVWAALPCLPDRSGPVQSFHLALGRLGWSWPAVDVVVDPSGFRHSIAAVAFRGPARSGFCHALRDSYRRSALSNAAARRADMQGAADGIDGPVCRSSLRRLQPRSRLPSSHSSRCCCYGGSCCPCSWPSGRGTSLSALPP